MTPDQSPSSCPFCGAVFKESTEDGVDKEFRCGTWVASEILNPQRTLRCIEAERERLTRERDEARAERDALRVHCLIADQCLDEFYGIVSRYGETVARVKRLESEVEAHAHDLSPAMVQARNDQLNAENAKLQERIRTLEAQTLADSKELQKQDADIERLTRERDKEAAKADHLCVYSTSLEVAIRNLTKERDDILARVKRLEEAGDELLRDNDDMANISRWHKAKEATS